MVDRKDKDFKATGLSVDSVIKLHRLVTIPKDIIKRQLGAMPSKHQGEIDAKLKDLLTCNKRRYTVKALRQAGFSAKAFCLVSCYHKSSYGGRDVG